MSISGSITALPAPGRQGRRDVAGFREVLADLDVESMTEREQIDLIEELERLKSAAAAVQARATASFATVQRATTTRGNADKLTRSIAAQVALARHDSPARGQQHLGLARALVEEMPHTFAALTRGDINEWRATVMMRETSLLSREDRAQVDRELSPRLAELGDRRLADAARGLAHRLDPGAAVRRARKAASERRVSLRPAPDTMSRLAGLLPVADGVAVFVALSRRADTLRAQGDPRTRAQLMADLLVELVTGKATGEASAGSATEAGTTTGVDIDIQLVIPERTLLRGSHESAVIPGFGPIPASLARRLVREAHKVWLRRLYTSPETGELVAMDSKRRLFTGRLRDLLVLRDQTCRTPWCDAPVRHVDHVRATAAGGPTNADNAQGLCEACNYVKESPGWRADVIHLRPGVTCVETTTPTGHRHRSQAPPQPGADPPRSGRAQWRRIIDDTA